MFLNDKVTIWINFKKDAGPKLWSKSTLNSFLYCCIPLTKSLLLSCFCFPVKGYYSLLQRTVPGYVEEGKGENTYNMLYAYLS